MARIILGALSGLIMGIALSFLVSIAAVVASFVSETAVSVPGLISVEVVYEDKVPLPAVFFEPHFVGIFVFSLACALILGFRRAYQTNASSQK